MRFESRGGPRFQSAYLEQARKCGRKGREDIFNVHEGLRHLIFLLQRHIVSVQSRLVLLPPSSPEGSHSMSPPALFNFLRTESSWRTLSKLSAFISLCSITNFIHACRKTRRFVPSFVTHVLKVACKNKLIGGTMRLEISDFHTRGRPINCYCPRRRR